MGLINYYKANIFNLQFLVNVNVFSYDVGLQSLKGALMANFDRNGVLLTTAQKFKNIPLPLAISRLLVKDHKGWAMTKNSYVASGKGDVLNKELYRITLKNGKNTQNIKIVPDRLPSGLVSN